MGLEKREVKVLEFCWFVRACVLLSFVFPPPSCVKDFLLELR
jgi:hypothetical protein